MESHVKTCVNMAEEYGWMDGWMDGWSYFAGCDDDDAADDGDGDSI